MSDPLDRLNIPEHVRIERLRQREAERLEAIATNPDNMYCVGVSAKPFIFQAPGETLAYPALYLEWAAAEGYEAPEGFLLVMLPGAWDQFLAIMADAVFKARAVAVATNRDNRLARQHQDPGTPEQ